MIQRIWFWLNNLLREDVIIWHHTIIHPSAEIGEGTTIGSFCEIGPNVKIGKNCRVGAFSFIPEGVTIEDNCFVGPGTIFSNDMYPPSKGPKETWLVSTTMGNGAALGAGVCVRPGANIAEDSLVGIGAVVVNPNNKNGLVWTGTPARPHKKGAKRVN